jgi:phosphoribosylformylglycinamidine synthase
VIYRAIIRPKDGILDPEGQAVTSSLRNLGYEVREARVGRVVHLEVDASDESSGRREVEQMCEKLLANPLIEVFEVERVG